LRPGAAARRRDLRNVRRLLIGDEHDREQALRGGSGGYVTHNSTGDPFVWTATADSILEKVRRGRVTLDAIAS